MKQEIYVLKNSIFSVKYYRYAFQEFETAISTIEEYLRKNHFLNDDNYYREIDEIALLIDGLSNWKSDRDRRQQEAIQDKISKLCHSIIEENKKIFIVHGRNTIHRDKVSSVIGRLKLDYVILESESNKGLTIIEKFVKNAEECEYAIVLFSADDEGKLTNENSAFRPRVRQNVILELGFFLSKVKRENIIILHEVNKDIEKPSDFNGIVYEPLDEYGAWKNKLIREMRGAGIYINPELADRI